MRFGEDVPLCVKLRKNTFGSVQNLASYPYQDEIMCTNDKGNPDTYRIPAMMRRGNETVPKGVLDLYQLYNKNRRRNHVIFQIPDTAWMLENGWIREGQENKGPFVIRYLRIYPLPIQSKDRGIIGPIHVRLSLIKNIWNGKEVLFDEYIANKLSYSQNDINCP